MLQIALGAALTTLGAAARPSGAVTVLSAANTVITGLLSYLKGQGLPIRLELYLHWLRTLREHIEERERELLEQDCPLDVDEEINRIVDGGYSTLCFPLHNREFHRRILLMQLLWRCTSNHRVLFIHQQLISTRGTPPLTVDGEGQSSLSPDMQRFKHAGSLHVSSVHVPCARTVFSSFTQRLSALQLSKPPMVCVMQHMLCTPGSCCTAASRVGHRGCRRMRRWGSSSWRNIEGRSARGRKEASHGRRVPVQYSLSTMWGIRILCGRLDFMRRQREREHSMICRKRQQHRLESFGILQNTSDQ